MGPAVHETIEAGPDASAATTACDKDVLHDDRLVAVYQCIFCAAAFARRSELQAHLPAHIDRPSEAPDTASEGTVSRTRERPMSCPVCGEFSAWTEPELVQHLNSHILGYTCLFCDFVTLKRTRLHSHLPQHAFERNFKCELCGMSFYKKEVLSKHLKTHGPKTLACALCDHKTYSQRMLDEHRTAKHSSEKSHKCKDCGERFRHSADLSIHRRKVHNVENKRFGKGDVKRCPDCEFETKRRPAFILHRLEAHESFRVIRTDPSLLRCGIEECDFQVDSEQKFVTHIQTKHGTTRAASAHGYHQCMLCRLCMPTEKCTHTATGRSRRLGHCWKTRRRLLISNATQSSENVVTSKDAYDNLEQGVDVTISDEVDSVLPAGQSPRQYERL